MKIARVQRLSLVAILVAGAFTSASAQTNTFPTTGNAGVGTTSPDSPLSIYSANPQKAPLLIDRGYDGARVQFRYGGDATSAEMGMTWFGSGRITLWNGANLNSTAASHASSPLQAVTNYPSWLTYYDTYNDVFDVRRIPAGGSAATLLRITNNGNVGIGTTGPSEKLTVVAPASGTSTALRLERGVGGAYWNMNLDGNGLGFTYNTTAANQEKLYIASNGNIGIATTGPTGKLHVFANNPPSLTGGAAAGVTITNQAVSGTELAIGADLGGAPYEGWVQVRHASNGTAYPLALNPLGGNVGIGTTNPTQKLSVNGTIRAKEVIVETSPWPDDVFAPGYTLPSVDEVAAHIESEGHLPGVPSAATVAEQGIAVGEMQKMLLRKIEEITLYVIAQQEDLKELRAENSELRSRLEEIENDHE